jgi:hypothetical protein
MNTVRRIIRTTTVLLIVCLTFSCNRKKSPEDLISEKIETAAKASRFFDDSELSDFKKYEIVTIKFEELPGYKTILSDLETYNSLLDEASRLKNGEKVEHGQLSDYPKENLDLYIKTVETEIMGKKHRLSSMKEMCTDTMYKVVCQEHIKLNGNGDGLLTHAHIYLNNKFQVVDYVH